MAGERSDQSVVLVSPTAPAPSGNGLAMRAGMFLDVLAAEHAVDVVIVPVAGPADTTSWVEARARRIVVVEPVDDRGAREHAVAQLADPELRARLEATAPLPARVALAPPTLAQPAAEELRRGGSRPAAIVTLREHLVPFGLSLARHLGAARTVVDLDDDVEVLLTEQGDIAGASSHHRLLRAWLGDADIVALASPVDAGRVAQRYGRDDVVAIPNAITPRSRPSPLPGHDRALLVGNLTYGPNVEAARFVVTDVWPSVLGRRPKATLELVGRAGERLADLGDARSVTLTGFVEDLAPHYAAADVVVAPLLHGSGTRLKVLEAFAHHRPVVATTVGAAGIDVHDGVELLVADGPDAFAAAVVRVLADRPLAERLAAAGSAALARRYTPDAVAPLIRSAVLGGPDDSREATRP